jgi:hypothetical protein
MLSLFQELAMADDMAARRHIFIKRYGLGYFGTTLAVLCTVALAVAAFGGVRSDIIFLAVPFCVISYGFGYIWSVAVWRFIQAAYAREAERLKKVHDQEK